MWQKIKTANLTGSVSRNAGGLFESVRRLVQHLAMRDMEVRVFGIADEFTAEDLAAWAPVHVAALPPAWPRRFGYSRQFMRHLLDFSPDITHTHGLWLYPGAAAGAYSRKYRAPHVVSPHGMLDPWALRHSRWKKRVAFLLYEGNHLRHTSCIRALCQSEADSIRKLGLKNAIAVIPNGIDLPGSTRCAHEQAPERGERRDRARGEQTDGWPDNTDGRQAAVSLIQLVSGGRNVLLYLGRIHPKKGLVNLLKAWKLTLASQPAALNWLLVIAGWQQRGHEAELKLLASELGLAWSDAECTTQNLGTRTGIPGNLNARRPPVVLFTGPLFGAAKEAVYRNCQAFVLPSFSEGLPVAVLEAWAYAKAVLMTPACNLPEAFATGAALRIDPTPAGIAAGLRSLLAAPHSHLESLGSQGHELATAKFSWPIVAGQMQSLYQWLLGAGPKPACLLQ